MPGIGQVWPINGFPEPFCSSTAFNENSMIKNLYQKDGTKRDKYNNRVKEIRCCVDVTLFEIWNFQLYKQLYNLQWLSLIFYGIFEKRINKIAILIVRWSSHYNRVDRSIVYTFRLSTCGFRVCEVIRKQYRRN